MPLRRLSPLALALGLWACKPTVPYSPPPAYVDYAVFDLESSPPSIPQPNDLTLEFAATVAGAQGELLRTFAANGGFPYDQEVPVTVGFTRLAFDAATGASTASATDLDVASLKVCTSPATPCNLLVLRNRRAPARARADRRGRHELRGRHRHRHAHAPQRAGPDHGEPPLAGRRALPRRHPRRRGRGPRRGSGPVYPEAAFSLLLQGQDLSLPANSTLLPPGLGPQLEALRQNYLPAFAAVDNFFPSTELAVLTTFQIAPATVWVLADAGAGQVPLPSDFLLDPATGKVMDLSASPALAPLAPGLGDARRLLHHRHAPRPDLGANPRGERRPHRPREPERVPLRAPAGGGAPVLVDDLVRAAATSAAPTYVAEPPPPIAHDLATGQPCSSSLPYPHQPASRPPSASSPPCRCRRPEASWASRR